MGPGNKEMLAVDIGTRVRSNVTNTRTRIVGDQ